MDYSLSVNKLLDAYDKVALNYKLVEIYGDMYLITNEEKYLKKKEQVARCYQELGVRYYREQGKVDLVDIVLCKDKFCKNCQNILSKKRYMKFKPFLDKYVEDYDIYHVTLTVPNCSNWQLQTTLDDMYNAFSRFIKMFRRSKGKYKFLDLPFLDYQGCVRSLEITYNNETKQYHPHFHCLFIMSKDLPDERCVVNKFSYKAGAFNRAFTLLEEKIQKLWYLFYNHIKVTESNFANCLGYSCTCEVTNYDYKEVFKYTLKESFDFILDSEPVFMCLESALYNRRVIQGYGCLFNLDFDNDLDILVDNLYDDYVEELKFQEDPVYMVVTINELVDAVEKNHVNVFSKKLIKGVINYEE